MSQDECQENVRFLDILREGAMLDGDCGTGSHEKPPWLDKEKLLRIKDIYEAHAPGILMGHFVGQSMLSQVSSLSSLMLHTGNHSTLALATKRAVMTVNYVIGWYKGRVWDLDDPAHKTVLKVRAMHLAAQKMITKDRPKGRDEGPWMSQFDMALTQFAFVGALVLYPDKIGLYCSREELDCLIHFWRYIAYLLGTMDKYNLGSVPYEELLETCQDIVKEIAVPAFSNPVEEITEICITGTQGYSYLNPYLQYDSFHNLTCELMGIQGKHRTLDWWAYMSSWLFWLSPKLFRFQSLRELIVPRYRRVLESRIEAFLTNKSFKGHSEDKPNENAIS